MKSYVIWMTIFLLINSVPHLAVAVCCYRWFYIVARPWRRACFVAVGVSAIGVFTWRVGALTLFSGSPVALLSVLATSTLSLYGAALAFGIVTRYVGRRVVVEPQNNGHVPIFVREELASDILGGVIVELRREKRRAGI